MSKLARHDIDEFYFFFCLGSEMETSHANFMIRLRLRYEIHKI